MVDGDNREGLKSIDAGYRTGSDGINSTEFMLTMNGFIPKVILSFDLFKHQAEPPKSFEFKTICLSYVIFHIICSVDALL